MGDTPVIVHHSRYGPGMRRYPDERDPGTLLAAFGDARLIQHLDIRVEPVGGTEGHQTAAPDRLRRFLPEARLGATEADAVGEKEVILRRRS